MSRRHGSGPAWSTATLQTNWSAGITAQTFLSTRPARTESPGRSSVHRRPPGHAAVLPGGVRAAAAVSALCQFRSCLKKLSQIRFAPRRRCHATRPTQLFHSRGLFPRVTHFRPAERALLSSANRPHAAGRPVHVDARRCRDSPLGHLCRSSCSSGASSPRSPWPPRSRHRHGATAAFLSHSSLWSLCLCDSMAGQEVSRDAERSGTGAGNRGPA